MNTTPGPRLIEPGDRLPLAPCRLQGKLRRARDPAIDGLSARPCIRQASRPVGDVPQGLEQARTTEERAGRRLRRARCRKMDKREIEGLREKVGCAALLEKEGWKVDIKESTRRAIKYRRDSKIVIVIHDGRGWFDPLSTAKGDVFSLAEHLGADGFADACDRVADVVGFVPSAPAWQRPAKAEGRLRSIAERWRHRFEPRPGSPTWRYLTDERHIPDRHHRRRRCPMAGFGRARKAACGRRTAIPAAPSPAGRSVARAGAALRPAAPRSCFASGASDCVRICVTEAAVDAMSLAALEELRDDTLYVSTGGGWAPATEDAIRALARRANVLLVAATDNNRQGEVYAGRILCHRGGSRIPFRAVAAARRRLERGP